MPRQAPIDAAGVLHHLMIRGIERRKIFRDNKDLKNLLNRLESLLPEANCHCYAWAFLDNHIHFLIDLLTDIPLPPLFRYSQLKLNF